MADDDVPSPIDFHDPIQARAWVEDTVRRRPYRADFFVAFVAALNERGSRAPDILELGSGPGHLAEQILRHCAVRRCVALDFSAAMHDLARARLKPFIDRVDFVQRDFREPDWGEGLGRFDAVVTLQAAHETRHKRHLPAFLRTARERLIAGGPLLYADHYAEEGSDKNPHLMVAREEQPIALENAGFGKVTLLLDNGGMALYAATNTITESG
jgi:SAM-dependent methyltransferase